MATFLTALSPLGDQKANFDARTQTLTVDIVPGRPVQVDFPLRLGTFEHLQPEELREVALFLKLKGRRSVDTLRRYSAEMEKFLVFLQVRGHGTLDEWVLMDYQDTLMAPDSALQSETRVRFNAVSPETADQYMSVVRSFVQHLTDKNLLAYNAAKQVPSVGTREATASSAHPALPPTNGRRSWKRSRACHGAHPGSAIAPNACGSVSYLGMLWR